MRALASHRAFERIVVGDLRADAAAEVASSAGRSGIEPRHVDARSPESLSSAMRDVDLVLNCVGPFYEHGPRILRAAIEARRDYVDVCDDLAPTRVMLELDPDARRAGVRALLGMGNSPGLANVFVRLCADLLLDTIESVDIMHAHGGEPEEGPAVIKHRIAAMKDDVPLFLDGRFVNVRQLEPSGRAHVVQTEFRDVGTLPVYPYPHPETITLPAYLPGVRRVTNLGVIVPLSYFELTQQMVRIGMCSDEPLEVGGASIVPLEVAVAHILRERPRLLQEAGITGPAGALKIVVSGTKAGRAETYVFQLSSRAAGAGEGTGIPAAAGAVWMARGGMREPGVRPPEAVVEPLEFIAIAMEMGKKLGAASGDAIHIERIDAEGRRSALPLPS